MLLVMLKIYQILKNLTSNEIKNKILNNMDLFDRHIISSPESVNAVPKNLEKS